MNYTIEWKNGDIEVFDEKSDQLARIHKLEEQGFELGEDFNIGYRFK